MTGSLPQPSFIDAAKRLKKEVRVGGELFVVKTLGFLDGFRLEKLKTKFAKGDGDHLVRVESVIGMLDLALGDKTETIEADEVIGVMSVLLETNPEFPLLAWQIDRGNSSSGKKKNESIDFQWSIDLYEGRYLAKITALLAGTFGWTADYVLRELTGYEVAFFVQEALLIDHDHREWEYTLADVGFKKEGNEYRKQPFAPLLWMTRVAEIASRKAPIKIDQKYLPDGHIVDFTNLEQMRQMGLLGLYEKTFEAVEEKEEDGSNDNTGSIGNLRVDRQVPK